MHLEKRDTSLDVIRIIAIFFVLFTHTSNRGSKIYTNLVPGGGYYTFCISLDTIRMICVPLFLMLSGTLLLGKKEPIRVILKKRVWRIFVAIIVFSLIQYLWTIKNSELIFDVNEFIRSVFNGSIRGSYWYLYLYLAYLFLLPILRNIAAFMDRKLFIYIILVSALVDVLGLIAYEFPDWKSPGMGYIIFCSTNRNGYAFLFPLLGYGAYQYIQEKKLGKREYIFWSLVFMLVVCGCSWLVYNEYMNKGSYSEAHIWRFTALLTIPVYLIVYDIIRRVQVPIILRKVLALVSNSCFGIYLCENLLEAHTIKIYNYVYSLCGKQLLSCGVYLLCTIVLGTVIFSIIRKVPVIAKYV